jgi:peptide deformylase
MSSEPLAAADWEELRAASMGCLPPGRALPVVAAPGRVLDQVCETVAAADPEVVQLAADLLATMVVSPGCVGLAANQVGVGWRVFSLDVSGHPKARTCHGRLVLVNPRIVAATRNEKGREGCMSVPDFTGDVRRATRLTIAGELPGTGQHVLLATDAFEARAFQHEVDHLDGMLFVDRVAGAHAIFPRQTYL